MGYTPNEWRPLDVITSEKLNELEKGLTKTSENVVYGSGGAQQSSDGIHSLTYIEKGDALPNHPQVGDTIYMKDGNDFSILEWDGEQWNTRIDPKLSERIQTTLDTAKADTADQISKNNDEIKGTIDEVAQEKIDLAIKNADFNENAQAMADKALADAKANTAQVAQDTLDSANQNLAAAKSDLTDGLEKEVSDRTSAVSALDTKAQGYVDTAKTDLLETVNKEVTDRQNAVSALDTKATNAVNQAKSDINDTINALSVGGRNYILDTGNPKTQTSNGKDGQDLYDKAIFYKSLDQWGRTDIQYIISFDWNLKTVLTNDMVLRLIMNQSPWQNFAVTIPANKLSGHADITFTLLSSMISAKPTGITFRIMSQMDSGNTITYSNLFMKSGTIATDWSPAPEDVVLDYTTKDNQIKETITQYQTTNDGKVSKVQTDVTTALGQVATKVSQTDYNIKTGQLQTDLTTTTQTANQAKTDIASIKQTDTSQDSRMNTIESDASGTKQTVSNIQTKQGQQDASITTLQTRADGIEANVSKTQTAINDLQQINQITNSEFTPDFAGWHSGNDHQVADETSDVSAGWYRAGGRYNNSTVIGHQLWVGVNGIHTDLIPVGPTQQLSGSAVGYSNPDYDGTVTLAIDFAYYDSSKKLISSNRSQTAVVKNWTKIILQATTPANTSYVSFAILTNGSNGVNYYSQPMLVFSNTLGSYVKGSYNNNGATAKAQLTADQATLSINNYKTEADGRISKAQSDITQTANQVATKVSQNDYNAKTSELTTNVNNVTQTANQSKQDIVAIKQKDGNQDARMTQIESDASGVKTTVSDLRTAQGKQSGDISTLQQRADGFDVTVTKVDNLSVGGRNYVQNSSGLNGSSTVRPTLIGATSGANATVTYPSDGILMTNGATNTTTEWYYQVANAWQDISKTPLTPGKQITFSADVMGTVPQAVLRYGFNGGTGGKEGSKNFDINNTSWTRVSITVTSTSTNTGLYFRIQGGMNNQYTNGWSGGETLKFRYVKIEDGNTPTAWTPAPEDVDSATAKAQLTADNAALAVTKLTSADGIITKAQADIRANADAISQKVSKTVYDQKTGDLTQAVSKAQTTADGVVTTVGNYKTSNDARVKAAESAISQNSNDITARVTKTDYDNDNSKLNTRFTKVEATANGASTTVGELSTAVNNLSQVNLINNSDFSPDLGDWTTRGAGNYTTGDYDYHGGVYVVESTSGSLARTNSAPIPLNGTGSKAYSLSFNAYIFSLPSGGRVVSQLTFLDANLNETSNVYPGFTEIGPKGTGNWFNIKLDNIVFTPPEGAEYIVFSFDARGVGTKAGFNRPILVSGSTVGSYVRGQYSNNNKIALQQITIDSISDIVSNPTTGLSTRVQTAEGTLSKVQGTDIPALQNATFWQPYSSLNFNDYTKQGSFFFNTTAAKTNGPTTSSAWMYLMVEQGTSAKDRIKQTAWYDGVTGVKITYVRTLNSGTWSPWYANDNDSVTTISQTNSDVRQEIENRKTGDNNTLQSSKDFTTSSITSYDKGIQSQFTQTASGILAQVESTNMVVNSEFDPLNGTWYALSNGGAVGSTAGGAWNATVASGFADWPVVNGSRIIPYSSATWYTSALVSASAGKVFSASIVAGRSPAPAVSTALDFRIGFWDSNRELLTTASAGNIIDGTSYKGVQKYVVENKIAPANTKFVSVIIAHSSANATDYITRPSLNTGDKASPYTPTYGTSSSATVLSLLKDNWSIGITDNIGKITSGIVGNASQMSLISKNVTIDSPSTQITGTAWINSAMIGNGSIANANIADAAITSAKIAQLDVAKLTGDTTSFIKSNWSSAYGNVSITPTNITLQSYSGTSLMTELDIGNLGMTIKMPGISSFLDSTIINANGMSFQHSGGSYATVGVMDAGFTLENNQLGGSPMSIRIGDGGTSKGGKNSANDMAFAISAAQDNGTAPQLIWAGSRVGKVSSQYRTWDNPQGFILADNIKFSTWDNTASRVEIDDTVNFYNYAPTQVYGQRFTDGTTRTLHLSGKEVSSGAKWFGFLGGGDQAGFGTDNTNDVIFFMKGKTYSLYTMLGKLGMR